MISELGGRRAEGWSTTSGARCVLVALLLLGSVWGRGLRTTAFAGDVAPGEARDTVHSDEDTGFRMRIPANWHIGDAKILDMMNKLYDLTTRLRGEGPWTARVVLIASKHPITKEKQTNPMLAVTSGVIRDELKGSSATELLSRSLQGGGGCRTIEPPRSATLGGTAVARAELECSPGNLQRQFLLVLRGRVLLIQINGSDTAQLSEGQSVAATLEVIER